MNRNDIQALVRPNIASLCPYSTARDEFEGSIGIFLDANESPYPTGYNRYPDPHQKLLKQKISELKGVPVERIFAGNGSDEAIDLVFRVFCEPGRDNIVAITPSYGMYTVAAAINDIEVREVPLNADFSLPSGRLLAACDSRTKAMFVCSPNNPTGNAFSNEELLQLADSFKGILVVDEAYIDFSPIPSLLPQLDAHPNIIILQTLSKAWGMAGLRLGLAFADPYVIALMSRVKYPYNINQEAQKAALKQLEEPNDGRVAEIVSERLRVMEALASLPCVHEVYPSDANFVLIRVDDANALYDKLLADGIIVRNRTKMPLCEGCLRITIGLTEENDRMLESIRNFK